MGAKQRRRRPQAPPAPTPVHVDASSRSGAWLLVIPLLLAALYCFTPHRASDPDSLSRLAMGRLQSQQLLLPESDPFTFAAPGVRFGNPEWLGDLGLYAVQNHFGESGLQSYALALGALGYLLALGLGMALGADAWVMLALLLCTLPVVGPRIGARNDLHTLWLLPAFAWVGVRAEVGSTRSWLGLLALGVLWANLHGSFVLGGVLLFALLLDARTGWPAWLVLALYPLSPWLGLAGTSTYAQLLDHLQGASVYRALISEWRSPLSSGGLLAILPLHAIALLGVIALWRERQRSRWLPPVLFLLATVLAYGSRRFLPLMAAGMLPAAAPAITRLLTTWPRGGKALGWLCVLAYVGLGLRSVSHRPDNPIWGGSETPEAAAEFIATHAPDDARIANGFDDGPWLVWRTAPRVRHYLDPRNNLGAGVLARYVREILPSPASFEAEAQRLGISLALIRTRDATLFALARSLQQSAAWRLVYWDGHHSLYARELPANRALIDSFGYRVLRPTLQLDYLDPSNPVLARDLSLLEAQSRPLAAAIRARLRREK